MEKDFSEVLELEEQVSSKIDDTRNELADIAKIEDLEEKSSRLSKVGRSIAECKGLIREFEREARAEDMGQAELAERKRKLTRKLNAAINRKKAMQQELDDRDSLFAPTSAAAATAATLGGVEASTSYGAKASQAREEDMTTQQLVSEGQSVMRDDEQTLVRSKKLVEETVNIGTETAVTVKKQTEQIDRIVSDLDEIHFSLRKAGVLIRDITRAIATDKCIMALMMLVAIGVVAVIVYTIVKDSGSSDSNAGSQLGGYGMPSCFLLVIFVFQIILI